MGGGWAAPSWAGEELSRLEWTLEVDEAVMESAQVVGGLDAPALSWRDAIGGSHCPLCLNFLV